MAQLASESSVAAAWRAPFRRAEALTVMLRSPLLGMSIQTR